MKDGLIVAGFGGGAGGVACQGKSVRDPAMAQTVRRPFLDSRASRAATAKSRSIISDSGMTARYAWTRVAATRAGCRKSAPVAGPLSLTLWQRPQSAFFEIDGVPDEAVNLVGRRPAKPPIARAGRSARRQR